LFPRDGRQWTADLNLNKASSGNTSSLNSFYYNAQEIQTGTSQQNQQGEGSNTFLTMQTDYTDPWTENMKIEAGLRAAVREFTSENHVFLYDDSTNVFVEVPDVNNYDYNDQVYAGYATLSGKVKKFQYQAGLRLESSFYTGILTDSNESFSNNFPVSLFPSGFLTYPTGKNSDVQMNYSRRIDRPTFFQMIPFTDYSDSLNLQRGNPDLQPQFTNTVELTYEQNFNKSNNLLASVYFKNTNNLITRYQVVEYDSVLMSQQIINTYENANSSYLYGLELTSTNAIKKWFSVSTNLNFYQSYIDGSNIEGDLTNSQFSWFAKVNATFRAPLNFTFQLSGDYQSKTSIPQGGSSGFGGGGGRGMGGGFGGTPPATLQGYVKPVYGVDFSIKKEFLKNKAAAITLSFADIFASRKYTTYYESDFFTQTSTRLRDPQFIRLNSSYKFGKFDTSVFKRKNTPNNGEIMQDLGGPN
jgi:hypothetical protein